MKKALIIFLLFNFILSGFLLDYPKSNSKVYAQSIIPIKYPIIKLTPEKQTISEGEEAKFVLSITENNQLPVEISYPATVNFGYSKDIVPYTFYSGENYFNSRKGNDYFAVSGDGSEFPVTVTITIPDSNHIDSERVISSKVYVKNNIPTVVITPDNPVYEEGSSVILSANVTNGNPDYTYSWSGACSGNGNQATTPSVVGDYTCTVNISDIDGDTATDSVNITVNEKSENSEVPKDDEVMPVEDEEGIVNSATTSTATSTLMGSDEQEIIVPDKNSQEGLKILDYFILIGVTFGVLGLLALLLIIIIKRKKLLDKKNTVPNKE